MIPGLLDHLWQSTLFTGGAALLTLLLRRHPARLRFRLWFAASLKFLFPFVILSSMGEGLSRLFPASVPHLMLVIQPAAERLSAPAQTLAALKHAPSVVLMPVLTAIWLAGLTVVLGLRLVRWLKLNSVKRQARDLELAVPVDVKASISLLEPGLVGIIRPVVILPEGLMSQLSKAERDAILAHELSHFRSDDNLTASIHMLVEALFWFYPPVWLIGARLIAERERACDECVLAEGHDAEVYAQSILKVCRFCVQSPLACASGASGADLGSRMRQIMSADTVSVLHPAQKLMLVAVLCSALGLPVAEGFFVARPLMQEMQQRVAAVKFGVATSILQVAAQARQISLSSVARTKLKRVSRLKTATLPQQPSLQAKEATDVDPPPMPTAATMLASVVSPQPSDTAASAPSAAPEAQSNLSTPISTPIREVLVALYPQGNGDPDGVTCRLPEVLPGSRLPGPRVCQTNRQWALLRAHHEDIAPDGQSIIRPDGSEEHASYVVRNCALVGRITANWVANPLGLPLNVCF